MNKLDYVVVRNEDLSKLEQEVLEYLNKGYVTAGGLCVANYLSGPNRDSDHYTADTLFCQAVKFDPKDQPRKTMAVHRPLGIHPSRQRLGVVCGAYWPPVITKVENQESYSFDFRPRPIEVDTPYVLIDFLHRLHVTRSNPAYSMADDKFIAAWETGLTAMYGLINRMPAMIAGGEDSVVIQAMVNVLKLGSSRDDLVDYVGGAENLQSWHEAGMLAFEYLEKYKGEKRG